jgi:hypothetical protein
MRKPLGVCFVVIAIAGCAAETEQDAVVPPADTASVVRVAVVPARIDRAQLAQLKWLEGRWSGSGTDTPTFYERYSFPTDSTMVTVSYRDSSMLEVADSSIYVLSGGQLSNGGNGPQWVLASFSADSVRFEPLARASNSFTWRRVNADEWTAVLGAPASGGDAAPSRTYTMRRVK